MRTLGFAILLIVLLSTNCFHSFAAEQAQHRVEIRAVPVELSVDGSIEAVHQATVSAQLAGRIQEVLFDVDDFVKEGDILVRFRNPEQEAGVAQAKANLREAEARRTEAQVERDRVRKIFNEKLVAKSAMDKAEAEFQAADARYRSAQAAITRAREQFEHTLVRAPYSGIVTERHVEPGETATVGQPLLSGLSLERLRVSTQVPQSQIQAVREHRSARVSLPDGRELSAKDITVFPYADAHSHSFRVRVALPESQQDLYPGMRVVVRFQVGSAEQIRIPANAIAARGELTGVYVIDSTLGLQFRQIRIGREHAGLVQVLSGLHADERIALDPIAAGVALKQSRH